MSYTSKPPFATGMQNNAPNQQQQSGGQPNVPNTVPSGVPNIAIGNNANPSGNHLTNATSSVNMSAMNRQQLLHQQQQYQALLLQQPQLLLQQTQYLQQLQQQQQQQGQQLQPQQQFNQQQQQQQQHQQVAAIARMVSDMQKKNQQSNGNLNQTLSPSQQLQQLVQLQAASQPSILNMLQQAQAAQAHQQKPFQQQSVPLPSNTTITPVARQNLQSAQHSKSVNYPKSSAQNKQQQSLTQARRNTPITAKQSVASLPANIASQSLNASLATPKGFVGNLPPMKSATNVSSTNTINPSLILPKTGPTAMTTSGSASLHKAVSPSSVAVSALIMQKQLPETKSVSPAITALSIKTAPAPSTLTNKPNISPKTLTMPVTPLKSNVPSAIGQKLSPTSPRTKQTPRKNSNPIKTTPTSSVASTTASLVVSQTPAAAVTTTAAVGITPTKTSPSASVPISVVPLTTSMSSVSLAGKESTIKTVASTPNKIQITEAKPINLSSATVTSKTNSALISSVAVLPNSIAATLIEKSLADKPSATKPSAKTSQANTVKKTQESAKPDKTESTATPKTQSPVTSQKTTKTNDSVPKVDIKNNNPPAKSSAAIASLKINSDKKSAVTSSPAPSIITPAKGTVESKIKRNRLKTIPYQSPTPELELISKISASEANNSFKSAEDRLVLFYKNEFLAVRNADGGFFLCQAIQNVYKSSPKIRIRWLSEEELNSNIYSFDFYDFTDIECVLTTVSLEKQSKANFELTKAERERIENILKKAIDVEKGVVPRPKVTEENPDGLDLSLYKNESQIEKKTPVKRKPNEKKPNTSKRANNIKTPASARKAKKGRNSDEEDGDDENDVNYEPSKKSAKRNTKSSAKTYSKTTALQKKATTPTQVASKRDIPATKTSPSKVAAVESTPTTKRPATKRKLIEDERTNDKESGNAKAVDSATDGKLSDKEPAPKIAKPESKTTPKQAAGKSPAATVADSSPPSTPASGRTTRRSRN